MEMTTGTEQNERIARRVPEDVATGGDLDLIDELYAEDAVEHDPFGEHRGRERIKESVGAFVGAFSDFSATVEDVVAEGDTVAMRVTLRGTHDGPFMGLEPTGERVEVSNAVFTRIEDGKIAERWVHPDALGLLRQLGASEIPA
ncbi:ester cyclase [Halogeometricum luteum]|uniref:Ester cyclase n=1 Tax=Halogeometricum luteum TaxID=2950537 RepID=A0ABU2G226_9EURY|nr:ester cyclase [Halogeometricum sp. S3BR5-2]MDS0294828.1 ester cyclase [Halogeometricum sp. S3BR5-2]